MTTSHTNNSPGAPVTVLGLGPMGSALAGAFLRNGHPTTVWNRTPEKADPLVAQGALRAASVAEAVAASRLVVVCVLNYDAVDPVLSQADGALRGRTVVNLTSDTPERARQAAQWASEQGIDYLEGSIMTPTVTIGEASARFLYSGPAALYESQQPILESLGGTATYLGADPGRAASHDVALLDLFWTSMSGVVHAFALAGREGITARDLLPYAKGITDLLPGIMEILAEHIDSGHYPGSESDLTSAVSAMSHIIHTTQAHGMDATVLSAGRSIAQQAVDAGHGADSFARLTDVLSKGATKG